MKIPSHLNCFRMPRWMFSGHKKCGFGHPLKEDQDGCVVKDGKYQTWCCDCWENATRKVTDAKAANMPRWDPKKRRDKS